MDSDDSIESFATELAQANRPEQPARADSVPAGAQPDGNDSPLLDALTDDQQPPEQGDQQPPGEGQSEQPEPGSEQAAEPVHKWTTANGETIEATESELRAGYLRTQDYTRKTQEVAETAKRAQAQFQQQQQILGALSADIGEIHSIQSQLQAFQSIDWGALEASDPQVADRARVKQLNLRHALSDAQGRMAHKVQGMRSIEREQFEQSVSAAEAHLKNKLPDVTREGIVKVFERMHAMGATQTELDYMRGMPWLVEAAVYADRWLDLQSKKPEALNKVRKLPPATTAPRSPVPTSKQEAALKAINSRRSFSTDEFAQLLRATR